MRNAFLAVAVCSSLCVAFGQTPEIIQRMVTNEVNSRAEKLRFVYESEERSARTGGHLWHEHVVETDDGPLRQLIAVDGTNLVPQESAAERRRLQQDMSHPASLHKAQAAMDADEARTLELLRNVPQAFLLTPAGSEDGCVSFAFHPNPNYVPASVEDGALQVLAGTISVREADARLCKLDATFTAPVEFGFGLLGHIDKGGHFLLIRRPVDLRAWKSTQIQVRIQGRIRLLKSISKDQSVTRTEVHLLPSHMSLVESEHYLK